MKVNHSHLFTRYSEGSYLPFQDNNVTMGSINELISGFRGPNQKNVAVTSVFIIFSILIGFLLVKAAIRGDVLSNTALVVISGLLSFGLTGAAAGRGKSLKISLVSGLTWAFSAFVFHWILLYDISLSTRFTGPYLYALVFYIFNPLRIVIIPATLGYIAGIIYHHRNHLVEQRTPILKHSILLILATAILWLSWIMLDPGLPPATPS